MRRGMLAALLVCLLILGTAGSGRAASRTGGIEGTVSHDGSPVAGATVSAAGRTVRTGRDGKFTFAPLPVSARYLLVDVVVRAAGYGEWRLASARVMPGDTLRVTAEVVRTAVSEKQPVPGALAGPAFSPGTPGPTQASTGSQTTPPGTIRVFVTGKTACDPKAEGQVRTVDFKEYVKHVLPNEWIGGWPAESLRAGAMAVKSYAWYQVNQGGKWPSLGADLMDSTCDQVYNPAVSYASTDRAVDDTWNQRMTRNGYIHVASYWAGARDDGGKPAAGTAYAGRLSQYGSEYWARQGKTWDWILNYYYDNIVISGATRADLRLYAGPTISSQRPVWGEPFTAGFTVRNYGSESMQLKELYIELRGPNGEDADLGGDGNATPLAPGQSRRVTRTVPALASPSRVYGAYTLTATYRDPSGLIAPGLPTGEPNTSTTLPVSVVAPSYSSQLLLSSDAAPRYYEGTQRGVYLKLRNSGNVTWQRTATATHRALRLGTTEPANRRSAFYVPGYWLSPSRIGMVETAVPPGGTATFRIRLGGAAAPGGYSEAFRLVAETPGGSRTWFGPRVTISPTVVADSTAPTASLSTPQFSTARSSNLSFPVRWSGTDRQSGVATYEVQWYDGAYKTWLAGTSLRSATFGAGGAPVALRPGKTYILRVRARDRAGNTGAWSARKLTAVPVDDAALTYTGGWGAVRATSYAHFLRTLHYSPYSGRVVSYRFYGRKVAWIGTRGPDKGRAEVWIDGSRTATVDLYSVTYRLRSAIYQKYLGARNAYHTVEIRALGKKNAQSKGTRVDVDGVAVVR